MGLLPHEGKREVLRRTKDKITEEYPQRGAKDLLKGSVLAVNKPAGPTSHEVCDFLKKRLREKSIGHGGTLDPNATGVLVVAVGNTTKILNTMLLGGKEYACLMRLHGEVDKKTLLKAFKEFTCKIYQRPPVKSSVNRELRAREIYYFDLLELDGRDALFLVGCEAGTYIRRLCHDLGLVLGCGAHMQQLVRTKSGPFKFTDACSVQDIVDAYEFYRDGDELGVKKYFRPVEEAVGHLKRIWVKDESLKYLRNGVQMRAGNVIALDNGIKKDEEIAVFSQANELVLLADAKMDAKEILKADEKEVVSKTKRVM